jgi:CUB/sushi domain-containing protein
MRACGSDVGNCEAGTQTCSNEAWGTCEGEVGAQAVDSCDAGDDANCNGTANDDCDCINGTSESCSVGPGCASGMRTCVNGVWDGGVADPCATDNGGCDALVTCGWDGSTVTCDACPTGYDDTNGDGTSCALVDCGVLTSQSNGSVSAPNGTTYNETATYSCDSGYALPGSATRTCQADGTWSGSAPTCTDIDECAGRPIPALPTTAAATCSSPARGTAAP